MEADTSANFYMPICRDWLAWDGTKRVATPQWQLPVCMEVVRTVYALGPALAPQFRFCSPAGVTNEQSSAWWWLTSRPGPGDTTRISESSPLTRYATLGLVLNSRRLSQRLMPRRLRQRLPPLRPIDQPVGLVSPAQRMGQKRGSLNQSRLLIGFSLARRGLHAPLRGPYLFHCEP